jgi:hypothetical protein
MGGRGAVGIAATLVGFGMGGRGAVGIAATLVGFGMGGRGAVGIAWAAAVNVIKMATSSAKRTQDVFWGIMNIS